MAAFPNTRWSLIQASAKRPGDVAAAWSDLVREYRPVIVGYFRRSALARDAEDLAQEFLLRSMREGWWARAVPERGSFRGFLRVLLQRFLAQECASGARRSETTSDTPLDAETAATESPERRFDLDFALCLTRAALRRLAADYAQDGRADVYAALEPWLAETPQAGALVALGAQLDIAPNTLAVQLKRLRTRFRRAVQAALEELCLDTDQASAELDALRGALALEASA